MAEGSIRLSSGQPRLGVPEVRTIKEMRTTYPSIMFYEEKNQVSTKGDYLGVTSSFDSCRSYDTA